MKPRLLDLFCGAGGCSVGYARAGFQVVGVDIKPQPRYPYEFHRADAMTFDLDGFDVVHASPPCQRFSRTRHLRDAQGRTDTTVDLLTPTLERLREWGGVWVVENVPGAPVPNPVTLCGSAFGLKVRRHRLFGSPLMLMGVRCRHTERPVGVYHRMADNIPHGGRTARTLTEARQVMGIDHMTWTELTQAIPPAYTEHIGAQLMDHLHS